MDLLNTRELVDGSPFAFTLFGKSGYLVSPRDVMQKVREGAVITRSENVKRFEPSAKAA